MVIAADGAAPAGQCAPRLRRAGNTGACNGAGGCQLAAASASCGAGASCTGSTYQPASHCNGSGACTQPASQSCGAYVCSGSSCHTSCTGEWRLRPAATSAAGTPASARPGSAWPARPPASARQRQLRRRCVLQRRELRRLPGVQPERRRHLCERHVRVCPTLTAGAGRTARAATRACATAAAPAQQQPSSTTCGARVVRGDDVSAGVILQRLGRLRAGRDGELQPLRLRRRRRVSRAAPGDGDCAGG